MVETLLIAAVGGSLFDWLHLPLPWMLGALTAVILWNNYTKRKMRCPKPVWYGGLIVVGYTIGGTFTWETVRAIGAQLPIMAVVTVISIVFNLLMGYLTHRRTSISLASGLLGSIPGGLSQMTALCAEIKEANLTVVTFMQTARVLAVVFFVPFLAIHGLNGAGSTVVQLPVAAGWGEISWLQGMSLLLVVPFSGYLAQKLRFPTPYLLGPVLASACVSLGGGVAPLPPATGNHLAQLCIGAYTGAKMNLEQLKKCRELLPFTVASVTGLIGLSLGIGWLLNRWIEMPLVTAFLSTAPGGIAEMSLTAIQVQADVSTIVAFQLFRLLFILLVVPPCLKWWLTREQAKVEWAVAERCEIRRSAEG